MNIVDKLEETARASPDMPAIISEARTQNYNQLLASVRNVAARLFGMNIPKGARAAVFLPNIPEYASVFLAVQKIDAVAIPINPRLTTEEVRFAIVDSGAELIFTTEELLSKVEPLLGLFPNKSRIIICDGRNDICSPSKDLKLPIQRPNENTAKEENRAAAIFYTSGTTGKPKGATLSERNLWFHANSCMTTWRMLSTDRVMLFLPLCHGFGTALMNTTLMAGATIVLTRQFEPEECLDSVESNSVTMFFGVPTAYIKILEKKVNAKKLASVRFFFSTGAKMPLQISVKWKEIFGRYIHEGYGLTEAINLTYNDRMSEKPESVGSPVNSVEVKIQDENGDEVVSGKTGEIVVRGPNVMIGYWNRPKENANAMRGDWFRTGDIGYLDQGGYCFIVDRAKDMINVSGYKVWPREVEQVICSHEAVSECAVVGMSDPIRGESVKAFVVLKSGRELGTPDLRAYCEERLSHYKIPKIIIFVNHLPKNSIGKVLKSQLREQER